MIESPFAAFAPILRRLGFRKTWESVAGGMSLREWKRDEPDGRVLVLQLWESGRHRISHDWCGCSDTTPTGFKTEAELHTAIEHERARMDSKFANPDNHHAPGAREFLLSKQKHSPPQTNHKETT
jgi:hypothetical protein